jgi:hypothetical protein
VGAVGLGVGTLAAYVRPGDTYRFYEISPTVVAFAEGAGGYFTWLSGAPGKIEVVLGDARTSLEREPPNAYDVLVIDAFSGDSVPTHLLTHVSNRYLDLLPVVAKLAQALQWQSLVVDADRRGDWSAASLWVLLSADANALRIDTVGVKTSPFATEQTGPLWTDEFTSLWGLVEW